jgi:GT2 family glycosyltransferase
MGNNIGYKYTDPLSEFIFFLNNDTEVEKDCLEKIVKTMMQNPSVGAAQPKIRRLSNRKKIDAVGGNVDYYGRAWHLGYNEYDYGQYDVISEIFYAQGAAIIVRRDAVKEIGLFDPAYFLYYEETDLCWRMWLAGYRVIVIPQAVIYHYGGGTTISKNSHHEQYLKTFCARKNHIMTMLKNYSLSNILKYSLPFLARMLITAVWWSLTGKKAEARAYYSAFLWITFHIDLIVRRRMFVQKTRKISDKRLMKMMKPLRKGSAQNMV